MLRVFLSENEAQLAQRWCDLIFDTYPESAARFLKARSNQFANPTGSTIKSEIATLLKGLIDGEEPKVLAAKVNTIVKIRAVQDFLPSAAVSFVFLLKQALKELLGERRYEPNLAEELSAFEDEIDRLALLVFDSYLACREQIFQLKISEIKDRSMMLQERMHRIQAETLGDRDNGPNNNVS